MRLLGVDFGMVRIGLAIGESEHELATPRAPLSASGKLKTDAAAIAAVVKKEQVDTVVVGLPIEEDGVEGKMARITRLLAGHLQDLGLTVSLVDERMTSVEAETGLRQLHLKASERRKLRDGEAASLILERFMQGESTH